MTVKQPLFGTRVRWALATLRAIRHHHRIKTSTGGLRSKVCPHCGKEVG